MNPTLKSILLASLCILALGACASHGQVRSTASVGAHYYPAPHGTYHNQLLYQSNYRYRAYPNFRLHPNARYHHRHHRTWHDRSLRHRHHHQHRNWRTHPHRPGVRPNRPDRVTPTPPVRRPEVRAPIRVNPIERRQIN